jgi:chitodextrinase
VPAAPTGLTASAITDTTTTLQWQPSSAPANQTISGYAVYENGVKIATTANDSYTVANLTAATTYAFAIAALDSAGSSAETTALSVTTGAASGGTGGTDQGGGSIPTWVAGAVYTGGMIVTIDGSTYQANWWSQGSDPTVDNGSGQPWTLIGGDPATPSIASVPQNLTAIGTSASSTVLTWSTSVVANNGKVTGYEVYENGKALASTTNTSFIATA